MENKETDMFEEEAKEIFKKAKVSLDTPKAKEFFEEVKIILHLKMAMLASTERLTWNRVKKYDEQKAALVDDLKNFLLNHPEDNVTLVFKYDDVKKCRDLILDDIKKGYPVQIDLNEMDFVISIIKKRFGKLQ